MDLLNPRPNVGDKTFGRGAKKNVVITGYFSLKFNSIQRKRKRFKLGTIRPKPIHDQIRIWNETGESSY